MRDLLFLFKGSLIRTMKVTTSCSFHTHYHLYLQKMWGWTSAKCANFSIRMARGHRRSRNWASMTGGDSCGVLSRNNGREWTKDWQVCKMQYSYGVRPLPQPRFGLDVQEEDRSMSGLAGDWPSQQPRLGLIVQGEDHTTSWLGWYRRKNLVYDEPRNGLWLNGAHRLIAGSLSPWSADWVWSLIVQWNIFSYRTIHDWMFLGWNVIESRTPWIRMC